MNAMISVGWISILIFAWDLILGTSVFRLRSSVPTEKEFRFNFKKASMHKSNFLKSNLKPKPIFIP